MRKIRNKKSAETETEICNNDTSSMKEEPPQKKRKSKSKNDSVNIENKATKPGQKIVTNKSVPLKSNSSNQNVQSPRSPHNSKNSSSLEMPVNLIKSNFVRETCIANGVKDPFQEDLEKHGFQKGTQHLNLPAFNYSSHYSANLQHHLGNIQYGIKSRLKLQKSINSPLTSLCRELEVYRTASPFDRRVTALEWHPKQANLLAVGSKGGDIILWNTENVGQDKMIQGSGEGGSCQALKFWPWDNSKVLTASIDGTVTLKDLETNDRLTLADTMNCHDHWYCSVDVLQSQYLVAAGRNKGTLHMMSSEGRMVYEHRLHKDKITHVEFSPREPWLLCTASTDHTVQLWDTRQLKDRKSALCVLAHDKAVNSAYFSQTDGCRLVTTDQGREIRMYQSPSWCLETCIQHPHRFFQHITPFKATWHPHLDLIVCGRYPDKNFPGSGNEPRTIDIFDAQDGRVVSQLYSRGADGLCPLNKFNRQGDALASGMGFHILLWSRQKEIERKQAELEMSFKQALGMGDSNNHGNSVKSKQLLNPGTADERTRFGARSRSKKSKMDSDTDDLKKKLSKVKSKTKNVMDEDLKKKKK
ncbi:DNA damage-binding protein 2-like [Dreissena polymorpha]|uniref:DNA damage-binding protein 2 n=1 Tax=Dreissena polymorpha TaxID=45954 RepID=A0A9D4H4E1_DREPO|nr:DNA damage-binding protein 2-like [Dreissena polymorpha]KAH3828368.1 hypothetical protein DPMN_130326 [Dreissena polymorpha]